MEEFGFEIHELFYGNNSIIISDSYISDAWIRDTYFDINGLKIGDERDKVQSIFSLDKNLIYRIPYPEGAIKFEFDKNRLTQINLSISIY